jgi:VacB/RNase II family 3'-5' exoribonuclease
MENNPNYIEFAQPSNRDNTHPPGGEGGHEYNHLSSQYSKYYPMHKHMSSEYSQHPFNNMMRQGGGTRPYYGRSNTANMGKKLAQKQPYQHGGIMSSVFNKRKKGVANYNRKGMKKLIFINSYEKCNDFSNYKGFMNLNLKFLKQNYKLKENEIDEVNMLKRAQSQFMMMQNFAQNTGQMGGYINMMNMANLQKQMGMFNMMGGNPIGVPGVPGVPNVPGIPNVPGVPFVPGVPNVNSNIASNTIMTQPNTVSNNSNIVNNINIYQMNNINNYIQPNTAGNMQHYNRNYYQEDNMYNNNNDNNMLYYESLSLQPYTFVKDPKVIDDNLKSGRYLQGVIRINKCHTHGYITVSGLVNDILIRGNRNLNQSLHLDEVIVELFPMVCWKPLFNKKIRKISLQKSEECMGVRKEDSQGITYSEVEGEDKDLDPEDGGEGGTNLKEDFENIEERLNYINKVYNLRPEGRIVKIVTSPNIDKPQIVTITHDKSLIFATPIDENIPKIFIKMKKFRRVEFIRKLESDKDFRNKYFLVKIVGWALNFKGPKGIIINELGNSGDIEVETEVLLRGYDVHYGPEYPHQAMEELKDIIDGGLKVTDELLAKRTDLRQEIIFTIDPETSKDLDDAISVKVIDESTGLLEIGVHIADPSHFVRKDSLLDKEALERITTVYLVHKNIPMLPRILSENLCSLLPYQDRLSISCVFRIYLNGALDTTFQPKFFLSIMNSTAKWYYELVQRIIEGEDIKYEDLSEEKGTKPKSEEIFNAMVRDVKLLHKLTKLVRGQRIQSGSLIIENEELAFTLAHDNTPIGFKIKAKKDANNLIEELMLIANKLCAEYLYSEVQTHALVRKHPLLNDNKFLEIQRYLTMNKLIIDFEDPQELNEMLLNLKNTNLTKYICVQRKMKTFMQRAEYIICGHHDISELRHSALNFDLYTHFTSPIRRYPDMVVHRQLKHILNKGDEQYALFNYERFVESFNEKYVNGKLISQKCQKLFHCLYLRNQPMQNYKAVIFDINNKGNNKTKRLGSVGTMVSVPMDNSPVVCLYIESLNLEIVKIEK